MKKNLVLFIAGLCILFFAVPSGAAGVFSRTGLEHRLGRYVPPDISLRDEGGKTVTMGELLGRPVVLALAYYRCMHICPQLLSGISRVVGSIPLRAGKDYSIITVSFDDRDTPETAKALKANYLKAIGRPFPRDSWKFLTGDRHNIRRLLTAVGYSVRKKEGGFDHPAVLIFLSPKGKITQYLNIPELDYAPAYPLAFSPVIFTEAVKKASLGKVMVVDDRAPLYCLLDRPHGYATFFRILKEAGLTMLIALGALFGFLSARDRKSKKERRR